MVAILYCFLNSEVRIPVAGVSRTSACMYVRFSSIYYSIKMYGFFLNVYDSFLLFTQS